MFSTGGMGKPTEDVLKRVEIFGRELAVATARVSITADTTSRKAMH